MTSEMKRKNISFLKSLFIHSFECSLNSLPMFESWLLEWNIQYIYQTIIIITVLFIKIMLVPFFFLCQILTAINLVTPLRTDCRLQFIFRHFLQLLRSVSEITFWHLKEINNAAGRITSIKYLQRSQTEPRSGFSRLVRSTCERDSTDVAPFFHQVSSPLTSFYWSLVPLSRVPPQPGPRLFVPLLFQLQEEREESLERADVRRGPLARVWAAFWSEAAGGFERGCVNFVCF